MQKPTLLVAVLIAASLLAAACGGADTGQDQDRTSPSAEPTDTPAVVDPAGGDENPGAFEDADQAISPSDPVPPAKAIASQPVSAYDDALLMGDSVLDVIGPVQGKVVADLFAGNGYYTWKLLGAGARVLAIDPDPAVVNALQARKLAEHIGDDRLLVRQTQAGVPGLYPDEADLALITREFSTIEARDQYFKQLIPGIKAPHLMYLVNFMPGTSPFGPPASMRMDYNTVADELTELGFDDVGIYYRKLPYRYVLFANIPPETIDPEDLD